MSYSYPMLRGTVRCLIGAALLCTGFFALAAPAAAAASCPLSGFRCFFPPLVVSTPVDISPAQLPRRELVPVSLRGGLRVATRDGTQPSALREAVVDVDKDVAMDVRGLPVCGYRKIAARDVRTARQGCRRAIVGSGEAEASLLLPGAERMSTRSRLTVFNGGRRGRSTMLFVHGYAQLPQPKAVVARIKVERIAGGLHSVIRVPAIADGYGSLTEVSLNLKRSFFYRGQRRSFLSARCPDGKFIVKTPKTLFRNEARIPGVAAQTVLKGSLAVPCRPQG